MKSLKSLLLGSSFVVACLLCSGHAFAGVSNPDYYEIDISDSAISKVGGPGRMPNIAGEMDGDIAGSGAWTYDSASCTAAATSISGVTANWIVGASGTSGTVDPATNLVKFTLQMKIKFAGGGLPGTCQTSSFSVTVSTAKASTVYTGHVYHKTYGTFTAVAQEFTIPQVTAAACGGASNASTINTTFNFGAASGGVAMYLNGSITIPQIPQP